MKNLLYGVVDCGSKRAPVIGFGVVLDIGGVEEVE